VETKPHRGRPRKEQVVAEPVTKRPRGRPPKQEVVRESVTTGERPPKEPVVRESVPPRPRGRPRKAEVAAEIATKRPRGRPRNNEVARERVPDRPRGRPPRNDADSEPIAYISWHRGRAYGDFRAWAAWGGRREALIPEGGRFGTKDPNTAHKLFVKRLNELEELRQSHPNGLPSDNLDRIAAYIGHHVGKLENVEGRKRPTKEYVDNVETRLKNLARYFIKQGVTRLGQITAEHVDGCMIHLQTFRVRGRKLSTTTQRQYLDSLGHMLQRAVSEGRITRNWVREKVDLPTPNASPTELLEMGECALLIEAARRLFPPTAGGRPIYPLLAFLLLTGCIESEREGVEVTDVRLPGDPIFPNGVVIIRPNATRDHLKTLHRERMLPLPPQLAEILTDYLHGPGAPPGPLLFPEPGSCGSVPMGDWRKTLDQIAKAAGFPRGAVRTRRFRVSFATHRLGTLDELGQPMTAWKLRGEMGHGTEQMIERRYGRYTLLRGKRPVLEYRWPEWRSHLIDQFAAGLASILSHGQRTALQILGASPGGLSLIEWQTALGSNPGTFFPQRDRLHQLELIARDSQERGSPCRLTEDGKAVLAALKA
jgi:integrase